MSEKTIEQMLNERNAQKARLFGVLSESDRLKIAEILSSRQMSAQNLANQLCLPVTQVQAHLDQMQQAGFLKTHTHNSEALYRMDTDAIGLLRESILQWAQSMQGNHCSCGCH